MSEKDIYGALLKCSNPDCSNRLTRMNEYLNTCSSIADVDLNKLLVIDRFDWSKKVTDLVQFKAEIVELAKITVTLAPFDTPFSTIFETLPTLGLLITEPLTVTGLIMAFADQESFPFLL